MIIDDSALIRQLLSDILRQDPAIGAIESASDPIFALRKMEKIWPDVIVLDIEMPRMTGIEFLQKIMRERPTPVVILSSKTDKNMALGIETLKQGAFELIQKPATGLKDFLENAAENLLEVIKAAAGSDIAKAPVPGLPVNPAAPRARLTPVARGAVETLIVIGASTGGTVAIEKILTRIDYPHPAIVIVQHMPAGFTHAFAGRLDGLCASTVREARHGEALEMNHVYIAPGGLQSEVTPLGGQIKISVTDAPPVNRHRPSVDVLFDSTARLRQHRVLGILLTGMGADGARGLLGIRMRGGTTIAQDRASSVVFGMPAEAINLGAAEKICPLDEIETEIRAYAAV